MKIENLNQELVEYKNWLETQNVRESTKRMYYHSVKKFLRTNPDINDLNDYNDFLFEYSVKKRSTCYYSAIKNYIHYKIVDGTEKYNLMRALVKPKIQTPKTIRKKLDPETRQQIIDNIRDPKHKVIAKIQETTGVRSGDILRLRRGNISYEADGDILVMRLDLTEMKGGKRSVKWIYNLEVQEMIVDYIKNNFIDFEYYFLDRRSFEHNDEASVNKSNYLRYWRDLKDALAKSGVDFKDWATHDWRRNFADTAWSMKKDLLLLQRVMDHSDPATTTRYLVNSGLTSKDLLREIDDKSIDI